MKTLIALILIVLMIVSNQSTDIEKSKENFSVYLSEIESVISENGYDCEIIKVSVSGNEQKEWYEETYTTSYNGYELKIVLQYGYSGSLSGCIFDRNKWDSVSLWLSIPRDGVTSIDSNLFLKIVNRLSKEDVPIEENEDYINGFVERSKLYIMYEETKGFGYYVDTNLILDVYREKIVICSGINQPKLK